MAKIVHYLPYRIYNPNDAQRPFHESQATTRGFFTGNRTGKTRAGAQEALWYAYGEHPYRPEIKPPTKGWVVTPVSESGETVIWPEFKKILPPENTMKDHPVYGWKRVMKPNPRIEFNNNSTIYFKSCKGEEQSFEGASLNYVWIDEEATPAVYSACSARLSEKWRSMWMTLTPLHGMTWTYDAVYLKAHNNPIASGERFDFEVFHGTPYDNLANLEPGYIENELIAKCVEEELEARLYGRFVFFAGLILSEFNPAVHVIDARPEDVFPDFPRGMTHYIGIDNALARPFATVVLSVDRDGYFYITDEYYVPDSRKLNWGYDDHAQNVKIMQDYYNPALMVIDNDVNQPDPHSPKYSIMDIYRKRGVKRLALAQKRDKYKQIVTMKSWLKIPEAPDVPKLRVFRYPHRCIQQDFLPGNMAERNWAIWEMQRWRWADKPKGDKDHSEAEHPSNNHLMAGCRYISKFNPRYRENQSRVMYRKGYGPKSSPRISEKIGY